MRDHLHTLARYNQWANRRLYAVADTAGEEAFTRPMGAFFGSLRGTLNHILVADCLWLRRITGAGPQPPGLDTILHPGFAALRDAREAMDARIATTVAGLDDGALDGILEYRTIAGTPQRNRLSHVLLHLFNHQTHHRGQAHTLLSQLGQDAPVLDLIYFLREDQPG